MKTVNLLLTAGVIFFSAGSSFSEANIEERNSVKSECYRKEIQEYNNLKKVTAKILNVPQNQVQLLRSEVYFCEENGNGEYTTLLNTVYLYYAVIRNYNKSEVVPIYCSDPYTFFSTQEIKKMKSNKAPYKVETKVSPAVDPKDVDSRFNCSGKQIERIIDAYYETK